jgi:L-ribulokinase
VICKDSVFPSFLSASVKLVPDLASMLRIPVCIHKCKILMYFVRPLGTNLVRQTCNPLITELVNYTVRYTTESYCRGVLIVGKAVIGVDFGTESGRVVLVDAATGQLLGIHVTDYPHGVLDHALPSGEILDDDWALQHPEDYLVVLRSSIPEVLKQSGIPAWDVIGIGIDFTSCTMLPVNADGVPLCLLSEFRRRPHSWPKLWKHHAAKQEADDITTLAIERGESFLSRYGGVVSSEWMVPKILQILREDPDIYAAADRFMEAGDWVVFALTGEAVRNASGAGFKAMWMENGGPTPDFLGTLHPALKHVMSTKLRAPVVPVGSRAGLLLPRIASDIGLTAGIPVAAAIIDAFAAVPGSGVSDSGKMVMAMGTSTCHMVLSDELHLVHGMTGVVRDGILPGFYGYEAGQAAVGDIFAWFVEQCVPAGVLAEADRAGVSPHTLLEQMASRLTPGESGLVALDWWNGNRSILADARLSGLMVGMTLGTQPGEMYRTLIEATAFGTRRIVEQFVNSGVNVQELVACGGLPKRNRLLMQIYADVTGRVISVPKTDEATAMGAAMLGAAVTGRATGGYDTVTEAIQAMRCVETELYHPNPSHVRTYDKLYALYCHLHDSFGKGHVNVMHELRSIRQMAKSE